MTMGLSLRSGNFQIVVTELLDDGSIQITANMAGVSDLKLQDMKLLRRWLTTQIRKQEKRKNAISNSTNR